MHFFLHTLLAAMEEGASREKPQAEQKTDADHHNKSLWELIDELSWEIPLLRPILFFFVKEGKAVKNGWVAFLIMAGMCIYATHEFGKKKLERAEQERDKYFQALQPWQALAASIYTNAPPDKRVDMLLTNVSDIRGVLDRQFHRPTLEELKSELRAFLEGVSPQILPMVDDGAKEIGVMMSPVNQVKLDTLSQAKAFQIYLS